MDLYLVYIFKSVFQGGGVFKWMNVLWVFFVFFEVVNLGVFVFFFYLEMEGILGVGEMLDKVKY